MSRRPTGYSSSFVEDLQGLRQVIRRVIAARVSDPLLVEDLTQEALTQVLAADVALDAGARQAYAIVTARNLVTTSARRAATHARHAHLLGEPDRVEGPEQLSLQREEAAALAVAMQRLPDAERELLVRHEVQGDDLATLAARTGSTSGATATRLGRARAHLRLEFVLAFRRSPLPSDECRSVLLALSSGDRRQQQRAGAAQHLHHCPTCAELAAPLTERRRGIAAWLILPVDGLRRVGRSLRTNHWTQAAAAVVAGAAITTAVALSRPDPAIDTAPVPPPAAAPSSPPTTPAPAPSTTAMPACPPAVPLEQMAAPPAIGCPVGPTNVTATAVTRDEGFWAETATGQQIWVQLVGDGESPIDITEGITLTVFGTIADPTAAPLVADDERVGHAGFILLVPYDAVSGG
jgi:RNA polymerase sigma factor (sigma-70 family)